jgi:hypothetical protein
MALRISALLLALCLLGAFADDKAVVSILFAPFNKFLILCQTIEAIVQFE